MIYLNNAATTKIKPKEVLQAVNGFMKELNVSPGRGADEESVAADRILTEARELLAELFNVSDPSKIIFTLNCSDALNTAIKGVLRPGDHIIISPFEHNSVVRPLRYLEKLGIEVSVAVGCSVEGVLEPQVVERHIKSNTKLIAVLHASNVTGAVQPVKEIGEIARKKDLLFLVDAAQTAGSHEIDVKDMNIDLLAFAGHKGLMGPMGTGGIYVGSRVQGPGCRGIEPLRHGGTGSQSELEVQPDIMPDKFETGTPNTPGIAGLKEAVEFILKTGVDKIKDHGEKLTEKLLKGLTAAKNVKVYGPGDPSKQVPVVSFNIEGMEPTTVGKRMEDEFGIIVRTGLHCSPLCHKAVGTFPKGTVRISAGYFNTGKDIDAAVKAVRKIAGG